MPSTFFLFLMLLAPTSRADATTLLYGFNGPGIAPWSAEAGAALATTPTPLPEGSGCMAVPIPNSWWDQSIVVHETAGNAAIATGGQFSLSVSVDAGFPGASLAVHIVFASAANGWYDLGASPVPLATGWHTLTWSFDPAQITSSTYDLYLVTAGDGAGTVRFDNLTVGVPVYPSAPATVSIDANVLGRTISPYIYGAQEFYSDPTPAQTAALAQIAPTVWRWGGGNNSTKYNWRAHANSHPDWYNNNYGAYHEEAFAAMSGMSLPVVLTAPGIGWVARDSTTQYDWQTYDPSGARAAQNLNGTLNETMPLDVSRYLVPFDTTDLAAWIADLQTRYPGRVLAFQMDNEPEIWQGTHDDVRTTPMSYDDVWQQFRKSARTVKAHCPTCQVWGPVTCNEYWYYELGNGEEYGSAWLRWFLTKVRAYRDTTGVRLLDRLDVHLYTPGYDDPSAAGDPARFQYSRVFWDPTYSYPDCAGETNVLGSGVEMFWPRFRAWIDSTMGPGSGVGLALTEVSYGREAEPIGMAWYADLLGTASREGLDDLMPWFSLLSGNNVLPVGRALQLVDKKLLGHSVTATSSDLGLVHAYAARTALDTVVVLLVNASTTNDADVRLTWTSGAPSPLRVASTAGGPITDRAGTVADSVVHVGVNSITVVYGHASPVSVDEALPPMSAPVARTRVPAFDGYVSVTGQRLQRLDGAPSGVYLHWTPSGVEHIVRVR